MLLKSVCKACISKRVINDETGEVWSIEDESRWENDSEICCGVKYHTNNTKSITQAISITDNPPKGCLYPELHFLELEPSEKELKRLMDDAEDRVDKKSNDENSYFSFLNNIPKF